MKARKVLQTIIQMAIINSNHNSDHSNGTLSSSPSHSPVIVDGDDPVGSPAPSPAANGHRSSFGIARILKNDVPKVVVSSSGHIHHPVSVNSSLSFGIARLLRNDPPKVSSMADFIPSSAGNLMRPSYQQLPFANFTHPFLRFGPTSFTSQSRESELSSKYLNVIRTQH